MTEKPYSPLSSYLCDPHFQQFTYGVVSEGVFAESLLKFCGKFAKIYAKITKKKRNVLMRQEKGAKFCGKLRKFRGNLRNFFCNDPFPNDPISELLVFSFRQRRQFLNGAGLCFFQISQPQESWHPEPSKKVVSLNPASTLGHRGQGQCFQGGALRRADTQTPTRYSVFSTHSDTQAVPAFHCRIRTFKGIFSTR